MTDSLQMFETTATHYSVLTDVQTASLLLQVAAGQQQAVDTLILHNLRIAIQAAKSVMLLNRSLELCDLCLAAIDGLRNAIITCKPGYPFHNWALLHATYSVQKQLAEAGYAMRMPEAFVKDAGKVYCCRAELEHKLGHAPSIEELSVSTGMRPNHLKQILSYGEESFDRCYGEDDDELYNPLLNRYAASEKTDAGLCLPMEEILDRMLDSREADILKNTYGLGGCEEMKAEELAAQYHITAARVRQIRQTAIRKLQQRKDLFDAA